MGRISDIQKRCAELAQRQLELEPLQLPSWADSKRGAPNSFLRSALFAAIQSKDRSKVFVTKKIIFSQKNLRICYTGQQLNQEDMTVWLTLVDLCQPNQQGFTCMATAYAILKRMGLADGGKQRQVLQETLLRLTGGVVEVKAERKLYGSSLVDSFEIDEATGQFKVLLNKNMVWLFGEHDWTALDWQQRQKLRGKPLALKLHEYYSSHAQPHPVSVDFLRGIAGGTNPHKGSFKRQLGPALTALVAVNFLSSWQIEGDLITVTRCTALPSRDAQATVTRCTPTVTRRTKLPSPDAL